MKKLILSFLLVFAAAGMGMCDLSGDKINVYNLKKSNMYLLNLDSRAQQVDVSDRNVLNVILDTSISSEGKQLFIEANKTGVCDVSIRTEKQEYKIRFISGNVFEDTDGLLTTVDLPSILSKEI